MSATPRLFVHASLAPGADVTLTADQSHYVMHVMRLAPGDPVRIFNGVDGEFDARLQSAGKNLARLEVQHQTRPQAAGSDVWLLFAPLKKTATDFLVEKAVELGVADLRPVLTERTISRDVRTDRLSRIAIEASEQTERLDVPAVREAEKLARALAGWDASRPLFYADESGDDGGRPWGGETGRAPPMSECVRAVGGSRGAVLVGPEGGFSPTERAWLRSLTYVHAVGLGPRILRAETAAIVALALWQSVAGDCRSV